MLTRRSPDQQSDPRAQPDAGRAHLVLTAVSRGFLVGAIRVYQTAISPMTGPTCRYYPSCSQYALVAVQRHGALRGSWLAAKRLLRCHPWTPGGVDDVPPARVTEIPVGAEHDHRARSSQR